MLKFQKITLNQGEFMTISDPLERESEIDNKDETSKQADISPQGLLEKRLEEL